MDCSLPGSSIHRDSPGKNTRVGCHLDLPNPGIESKSPASRADSLPPEPSGKPKNTGMSSLSLLQRNFPTQEWNRGLLYCRWILYQLSQGKPKNTGMGNLSLLQWIFLTLESNRGHLYCRWILYQLSYEGSPWLWSSEKKLTLKLKLLEIFYLSHIIFFLFVCLETLI